MFDGDVSNYDTYKLRIMNQYCKIVIFNGHFFLQNVDNSFIYPNVTASSQMSETGFWPAEFGRRREMLSLLLAVLLCLLGLVVVVAVFYLCVAKNRTVGINKSTLKKIPILIVAGSGNLFSETSAASSLWEITRIAPGTAFNLLVFLFKKVHLLEFNIFLSRDIYEYSRCLESDSEIDNFRKF